MEQSLENESQQPKKELSKKMSLVLFGAGLFSVMLIITMSG